MSSTYPLIHKELLDSLQKSPEEVRRSLSEALRRATVLKVNETKLARRYVTLLEQEQHLRRENGKLRDDSSRMQASVTQRIGYLQRYKVARQRGTDIYGRCYSDMNGSQERSEVRRLCQNKLG